MPLKDGPMLRDDEIDMSTSSKTDKPTCNKLVCKLGYRKDDNIRYPKLIQQVYGRLKAEENNDGSRAQNRNLYKKLTQCSSNYPTAEDIPNNIECNNNNKGNNKSKKPPKASKARPSPPRNNSKRKKCPNGSRRNKKTGICESTTKNKAPTPPRREPTPPRNDSKRKRCPNGSRRNKKTGHCEHY